MPSPARSRMPARGRLPLAAAVVAAHVLAVSGAASARQLADDVPGRSPASSARAGDTKAPTAPTNLKAVTATANVTLTWTASTDNVGVAAYVVTVGSKRVRVTSPKAVVAGLSPLTTYAVSVKAVDKAGNYSIAAKLSVTTKADTAAPTAPASPVAAPTSSGANITWKASTDNVGVHHYRVTVDGTAQDVTTTSATVTSLAPSTAYTGSVMAVDAAGNTSAATNFSFTTTKPSDTTAPTVPTGLVVAPDATSAVATWSPSTDDVAVTGYTVVLKRGTTILSRETVTDTTKTFTGLTTGLSYSVLVRARDAAGNISVSAFTSFVAKAPADTTAPGAPTGLTGTTTPTTATLAWTASPDADVTAYTVTLTGGGATKTVDVTGTTAEVTGLDPETTYAVSVTARDAAGNTSVPATMSLTTPAAPDTIAPTMPGALTATATSATSATLSWTASTDAKGVTGYRVTLTKGTQPVSTTDVTGTGRTLTGLDPSTAYTVSVTARDAAGNISAAATATFATPALPDTTAPTAPTDLRTTAGTTSVTATWTASTDATGVAGYRVEARVAGTAVATADTTGTTATISGLQPGTDYVLVVIARDEAGNTSEPSRLGFATTSSTVPAADKVLYVATNGSDTADGSEAAPLLTIQKAVDKAVPGTTILIKAGTYASAASITIQKSGTKAEPITMRAAGDGKVVLTHPVSAASCDATSAAQDRTIKLTNGASHWIFEGLTIDNGLWIAGNQAQFAYSWITNYVNAEDWQSRREAPGHGTNDPELARTALVPFLRTKTDKPGLAWAEGIKIRNNEFTGRGIHAIFSAYGEASGNRIHDIDCGTGPGIWLITFSTGWKVTGNEVWNLADTTAHFMHEGIRLGSGSDYNEVSENYVHDIPGDGRGINTDVDSSWNWLHHNVVRRVAIGYNDQMSGWGNRWEYNLATDYRQWGLSIRMKDSSLTSPTPALSTTDVIVRCNIAKSPVGTGRAIGLGTSIRGTFTGNDFATVYVAPNLRTYWTSAGNTWNGSGAVPAATQTFDPTGC